MKIKIDIEGLKKEKVEKLREKEVKNEFSKEEIKEKKRKRYYQVTKDNKRCGKRRGNQAICREGAQKDSHKGKH